MANLESIENARLVHEKGLYVIELEIGRRVIEPVVALKLVHEISESSIPTESIEDLEAHDEAFEVLYGRLNAPGALEYLSKIYDPPSRIDKLKWMLSVRSDNQPTKLHTSIKWEVAKPLIKKPVEESEVRNLEIESN